MPAATFASTSRLFGLLVLGTAAVGLNACAEETCREREAVGYPEMKAMARTTLEGVDYTLERVSSCDESGDPVTVVRATIEGWPGRKAAYRFMEQRGWVRYHGPGSHESPDGAYYAYASREWRADEPESSASITFFEHADDTDQS